MSSELKRIAEKLLSDPVTKSAWNMMNVVKMFSLGSHEVYTLTSIL